MLAYVWVTRRREIATDGGSDEQIPAHDTAATFGLPSPSKVPMMSTGVGNKIVLGPMDFFMGRYFYAISSTACTSLVMPASASMIRLASM
jgi:hypothetical protein